MQKIIVTFIGLATVAVSGCADRQTALAFTVDDPYTTEVLTVTLEHAAAVVVPPYDTPVGPSVGGVVLYVGETSDVCGTLAMGFERGEEFFATVYLSDAEDAGYSLSVSGPDDMCDPWGRAEGLRHLETDANHVYAELESGKLWAAEAFPWANSNVTVEGSIEAEMCDGIFEPGALALQCGVPVSSD